MKIVAPLGLAILLAMLEGCANMSSNPSFPLEIGHASATNPPTPPFLPRPRFADPRSQLILDQACCAEDTVHPWHPGIPLRE
ncbi:MAG: hypothetical protein IT440_04950 [Phycisphaeraceae bacterium]|nr:hypothetical protein [Phycisphaeraceae bacterium]